LSDDDALPKTLLDVLDIVLREHGGRAAFNVKQLLAARGLVRVLNDINNGDTAKAASISALEGMLPPKLALAGGQIDLTKLSDDEIDALVGMHMKAGTAPAEPGSERAEIREFLDMNEGLRAERDRANERAAIAGQAEQVAKRLRDSAVEAYHELRVKLEAAEAALWAARQPLRQRVASGDRQQRRTTQAGSALGCEADLAATSRAWRSGAFDPKRIWRVALIPYLIFHAVRVYQPAFVAVYRLLDRHTLAATSQNGYLTPNAGTRRED
jgi:hypothetical protein